MSPARLPSSPRLPLSRGVSITLQPGQARTLHLRRRGGRQVHRLDHHRVAGIQRQRQTGAHVQILRRVVDVAPAPRHPQRALRLRRPHQTSSQIALWRPSGKRQKLSNQ